MVFLLIRTEEGHHWHKLIFDDLAEIPNWYGKEDIYIRSASFIGKNTKNENASMIHALVFDLDGQEIKELRMVMQFMRKGTNIPKATFCSAKWSWTAFVLCTRKAYSSDYEQYKKAQQTQRGNDENFIWNRYTSNIEKIQFQYCLQGFRMVGSASKMGKRYPVRAYRFSDEHYTIEN